MSMVGLRKRVFEKGRRSMPVRERMAKYANEIYAEYGAEILCGMFAMDGNKDSMRTYGMLKR